MPLPTTTAPEQLLLTWGERPGHGGHGVLVRAGHGGPAGPDARLLHRADQRDPALAGLIELPEPQPLDVTQRYAERSLGQLHRRAERRRPRTSTTSSCTDLEPGTRYYYQVSDGATPARRRRVASFETAPHGRAKFRFSSYGDLATPSWDLNASGNIWHESCDNSWFAVTAIENPGDGKGAPLFHLLNGDLCYANLDISNAPGVWRDFGINIARSRRQPAVDARARQPRDASSASDDHAGPRRAPRPAGSARRARRGTTGTARTATATTSAASCCRTTA